MPEDKTISPHVRAYMRRNSKKGAALGGHRSWAKLSKKEKSERGKRMAEARWGKRK